MHVFAAILQLNVEWHNLLLEVATSGCSRSTLVTEQAELVKRLPADLISFCQQLCSVELAELNAGVLQLQALAFRYTAPFLQAIPDVRTDFYGTHRLNTTANHHILRPGHHRLSAKLNCLKRRSALTIHCGPRHLKSQLGAQRHITTQIAGLRSNLHDHTKNKVIHFVGRNPGAIHQFIHHGSAHINRVHSAQPAVFSSGCGAHCTDDVCIGHMIPRSQLTGLWGAVEERLQRRHPDSGVQSDGFAVQIAALHNVRDFGSELIGVTESLRKLGDGDEWFTHLFGRPGE